MALSSPSQGLIAYTHVIYALHALTAISGVVTGSIFMPVAFICGLPSAVAVLMNYARRSEARGTWLETHFRWQIRTFWFATFWVVVTALVSLPLMLILIGFVVGLFGLATVAAWIIYRVIRGWLALREARPMSLPVA
ncbi:MAG TPA: hypothetical protein VHZ99_08205 [Steroidobacteraceae bacterium]|nr:hypothetical protein [Steroidobacteraceae bacterium]